MSTTAGADASFEIEDFLLKKGANVNKRDNHGRVPLHYAFLKTGNQNTPIDPIETVSSLCAVRGTVYSCFLTILTLAIVANNAHHGELCFFFVWTHQIWRSTWPTTTSARRCITLHKGAPPLVRSFSSIARPVWKIRTRTVLLLVPIL